MKFLDRFLKRPKPSSNESIDSPLRKALVELILASVREKDGRIRVEDALSAGATIVGERSIDATGDFPLRDHNLTPGARFFSDRANKLICGDKTHDNVRQYPEDTVIGILRSRLDSKLYADIEFPVMADVFKYYAANIGNVADWGKVPLSIPQDHLPRVPPLRVGFETRASVDAILSPTGEDKQRCLRLATESLAEILTMVTSAIDHKLALTLSLETINGMAKTVPMTLKAMELAQNNASAKTE